MKIFFYSALKNKAICDEIYTVLYKKIIYYFIFLIYKSIIFDLIKYETITSFSAFEKGTIKNRHMEKKITHFKSNYLLVCLTILFSFFSSQAQDTIDEQSFTTGSLPASWQQNAVTFTTSAGGYANFTSNTSTLTSPVYDLTNYINVTLSISVAKFGTGGDGPITVQISNDGGSTWTAQTFNSGTPTGSSYVDTVDQPITVTGSNVRIRFVRENSPSQKRFRNYVLKGELAPVGPTIIVDGSGISSFGEQDVLTYSGSQSFLVSGLNLTNDVLVTAPSANFEISLDNSTFSSSVSITNVSGTITDELVYVRFYPQSSGTITDQIVLTSSGATSQSVSVAGNGVVPQLAPPVANPATSIDSDSFVANWDAVSGATNYAIDISTSSTFTASNGFLTDLIISEYVEGSSSNKYIEIFNGTGADVDLSDYEISVYANGATAPGTTSALTGILVSGSTIVYKNPSANVYTGTVTNLGATNYNGNDVIALVKMGTNIDVVGVIGDSSNFAADVTLTRLPSVYSPTTSYNASEWISSTIDDVSNLGMHSFDGGLTPSYVSGYENLLVGNVTSYSITGLNQGTIYYYRVRAVGPNTSMNSNVINVTTTGTVTWTGATNTNWSTASNWSNDLVPDGTYDIEIPSGNPVLDTAFTVQTGSDLTISGTGTLTIDPTASLTVQGTTNFGGNLITLQSDATGTATIGEVSGTLSNATNVTVERYIPAKRAWRLLTAPLKGTTNNTIADNWQGTNNEGLLLFSPSTFQSQTMTGYATGGTAPNIYQYGTGWQIIPNLSTESIFGANATDTKAYQVFVTGTHGSSNIASGSQATTLRPTGELITGSVSHPLTANAYKLIANPYASPLNTEALVQANSGSKAWLLDPTVGFGAYVTYDGSNWSITPSGNDVNIQSGQGFLVRSSGASFEIQESHKITGNSNTWFERNVSSSDDKIRVLLYKQINNEWQLADGILAVNSADGNTAVDDTDAGKVSNFNESMMFRNGTNNLSIEYRALPQINEVQPIRLTGTTSTSYELRLFTENYNNSVLVPMLEDTQTGTFTTIPTDGSTVTVPFTGIVATGTNSDNRFKIVYQSALSNDVFNTLTVSVYPNPVNEGFLNVNLLEAGKATYNLYNLVGQEVLNGTLATQNSQVTLSNLQTGVYILSIDQAGKKYTTKVVVE